jgi:hypothetical protein
MLTACLEGPSNALHLIGSFVNGLHGKHVSSRARAAGAN